MLSFCWNGFAFLYDAKSGLHSPECDPLFAYVSDCSDERDSSGLGSSS